jgi:hypothetical protein
MENFISKSAFLNAFFCFILIQQTQAEVRVFEANPSYVGDGTPFFLDIDNNGVNDYRITVAANSPFTMEITGLNGNNMIETDGNGIAIALNDGAPVGNNSFENSVKIYEHPGTGYYFQLSVSKFLGLRFQVNGNTHFGYFNVVPYYGSCCPEANFTLALYTYGYETVPNQSITAGAEPTSVRNILAPEDFIVRVINRNIEVTSTVTINRLELIDITGKILRINSPKQLSLDISGLPRQVYFLTAYNEKSGLPIAVRKLFLGE